MSEAHDDPTHQATGKLTTDEAQNLADRLQSRGVSKLLDDQPELQRDMRTAAWVIRALLSKVDHAAAICSEAARHLRDLTIEVGGC
jgi:predicted RNA-binding Zn ribbon-like protein